MWYANHGWYVFATQVGAKEPRGGTHGLLDATIDEGQIRAWWEENPNYNIGVACGPSRLLVLDVDPKNGASLSDVAELYGADATQTVTSLTPSGGAHYIYAAGENRFGNNQDGRLGLGLDIRGVGGYIVVAPSVVGGITYRWEIGYGPHERQPAAIPETLVKQLSAPRPMAADSNVVELVPQGQRNQWLTSMAGRLRNNGMSAPEMEAALQVANATRCKPPLPTGEVRTISRSVARYEASNPVPVSPNSGPVRRIQCTPLNDFEEEEVEWIWNQRIPKAKITLLAGDGGQGKSFTTLGLAAALSTGTQLPEGSPREPISTLIWSGEDTPADTMRPRARLAGADLSRIHIIGDVDENGITRSFCLSDIPTVASILQERPEIGLFVIDPISALLGEHDTYKDSAVRAALQPLVDLTVKYKVATLLVMHLKKGEETSALHKISMSIAFGALARSVLFLGTHAVSGRKSIDCKKHSLAQEKPEPIEFALTTMGFRWLGLAPELTYESLLASQREANKLGMSPSPKPEFRSPLAAQEDADMLLAYADEKIQ